MLKACYKSQLLSLLPVSGPSGRALPAAPPQDLQRRRLSMQSVTVSLRKALVLGAEKRSTRGQRRPPELSYWSVLQRHCARLLYDAMVHSDQAASQDLRFVTVHLLPPVLAYWVDFLKREPAARETSRAAGRIAYIETDDEHMSNTLDFLGMLAECEGEDLLLACSPVDFITGFIAYKAQTARRGDQDSKDVDQCIAATCQLALAAPRLAQLMAAPGGALHQLTNLAFAACNVQTVLRIMHSFAHALA